MRKFILINKILNQYDPLGLLKIGAPADEYMQEARIVSAVLLKCENSEEVTREIHKVFVEKFDQDIAGPVENYISIGEDIWKMLRN